VGRRREEEESPLGCMAYLDKPKEPRRDGFQRYKANEPSFAGETMLEINKKPREPLRQIAEIYIFSRGNILDTVFRQDASPSWHGIEYGLELLKEGIIYRVGDGRNIDLWRDNWLPRDYNLKVTPRKTRSRIRRVSQLLLPENQAWNEELVKKVCYRYDAEWILKQKLPSNPCDDFVAWHYEKSGIFSVKSAYRLAYNLSQGTRWIPGNSHSVDNTRNVWNMFWNANVP
jgi:hypothetical protein